MNRLSQCGAALFGMAVAGACLGAQSAAAPAADGASATATLVDAHDKSVGKAVLTQATDGVLVKVSVSGLKAGTYAFHLHTTGKCDKPDFTTAGGHWNPTAHQHGKDNPQGPHMGDLPNIEVAASGLGALEQKIPGARLTGGDHPILDADGTSAMLHAGPDDYKTDPSGNSGARIACGVVTSASSR